MPLDIVDSHGLAEQSLSDISKALLLVRSIDNVSVQTLAVPWASRMHINMLSRSQQLSSSLCCMDFAQTLFEEERAAYDAALEDARDAEGNIDPLAALQHAATYQHHLASLIEIVLGMLLLLIALHCRSLMCHLEPCNPHTVRVIHQPNIYLLLQGRRCTACARAARRQSCSSGS